MIQIASNAALAVYLGVLVAIVAFVPIAALEYRRAGRFPLGRMVAWVAAAVSGVALWTYTLVPLPEAGEYVCAGVNPEWFAFVDDLRRAVSGASLREVLGSVVVQQAVFNVLLFLPLGFLLRALFRRGVVAAAGLGFAVSLLIELTQRTGIWGWYECAYRVFDVDDLVLNTTGAVIGSLLAWMFVRTPLPTIADGEVGDEVTLGRRWVGMVSDGVAVLVTGVPLVVLYRAWEIYHRGTLAEQVDADIQSLLQWGIPALLQTIAVLGFGRSIGEWVVGLRPHGPVAGRLLKLFFGVGGLIALVALPIPCSRTLALILVAVTVLAPIWTDQRRGLSNLVGGQRYVAPPAGDASAGEEAAADEGAG